MVRSGSSRVGAPCCREPSPPPAPLSHWCGRGGRNPGCTTTSTCLPEPGSCTFGARARLSKGHGAATTDLLAPAQGARCGCPVLVGNRRTLYGRSKPRCRRCAQLNQSTLGHRYPVQKAQMPGLLPLSTRWTRLHPRLLPVVSLTVPTNGQGPRVDVHCSSKRADVAVHPGLLPPLPLLCGREGAGGGEGSRRRADHSAGRFE